MENIDKNEWKLQNLKIDFKKGWSHEKSVDRYEGNLTFSNNVGESFTFNVDQFQAQKFLDIVGAEIIKTAHELGNKVASSLLNIEQPEIKQE